MPLSKKILIGAATVRMGVLPAGVTIFKPADELAGGALTLLFPLDHEIIVGSPSQVSTALSRTDMGWLINSRTYTLHAVRESAVVTLEVSAGIVRDSADPFWSPPVQANSSLALLGPVREFIKYLGRSNPARDRLSTYLTEKLVLEMVLALVLETQGLERVVSTVEESLYGRAMAYVAALKLNPDLSSATVAAAVAVSLRQLQRAFAAEGTSVTVEIRRHRVNAAVSMLTNPQFSHLNLAQIAQLSGFRSAAELRRALLATHQQTAGQIRRAA